MPVIIVSDSDKIQTPHQFFHFGAIGTALGSNRWLGHDGPQIRFMFDKTFKTQRRAREQQVVHCEPVEEIRIAQMEAEIVTLEYAIVLQEDVVFLTADPPLTPPQSFKFLCVLETPTRLRPPVQSFRFSQFEVADFPRSPLCRRR